MKTANIISSIALAGIASFMLFTNSAAPQPAPTDTKPQPHITHMPAIPTDLTAFGEAVPMHRPDVREALEREMLTNTFWHTNTILALKRAGRYFPIIEPILKESGIPDDMKYLCVAESSLVPTAKSPVGAVGLWQIMESTGKELGLEINAEVDERYHTEKSTRAACKFMLNAYNKLGSWALVAASYNGGLNRVMKNMTAQKQNDYYNILWGEETGRYVYRIIAIKTIMAEPEKYGFNRGDDFSYQPYQKRDTTVSTAIADIAQFAIDNGTTYKAIKLLNPWLRQNKLTNTRGKQYIISLPQQ